MQSRLGSSKEKVPGSQRLEMFGELHEYGGLDGKLLDAQEAREAVARHA
jgi:hypothetical protein